MAAKPSRVGAKQEQEQPCRHLASFVESPSDVPSSTFSAFFLSLQDDKPPFDKEHPLCVKGEVVR